MRLFLMLLLLCSHSAHSKGFDTEPQALETIDLPDGYKRIKYSKRYSFAVPGEFKTRRLSPGSRFLAITASNGKKGVFVVDEILASNRLLLRPKNYGLSGSRRALLSAIYNKNYISNDEVFETRQLIFELSKNIEVYTRDGFIFFREDRIDDSRFKAEFTISTPVNDDVLTISFLVDDEELIMNVIQSLKVN